MRTRLPDLSLLGTVLTLLGLGVVMVLSASSVESLAYYHTPYYFFERQLIWAGLGLAAMAWFARFDYWQLRRYAWPFAIATGVLLVAVLIPHVGREVLGARRWIGVGPLVFQPSELSKLSLVILFAHTLTEEQAEPWRFRRGVLPHLGLLAAAFALILAEPDLGTALSLAATAVVMLWVAGARGGHLVGIGLLAVPLVLLLILIEPYRLRRLTAFLNPQKDPLGSGYHIIQSMYAIGSGGLFGVGLGRSAIKYFYLPEQHTDFIFSILAEELGFLGALAVLALFLLFAWRGYRVALLAPDRFGAVLAAGLTTMVLVQALLNIAVVTASMPITGIPLPFLSYGGSALVFVLAGVGILLNISRHAGRRRL
jgi:cell division protein FtsW